VSNRIFFKSLSMIGGGATRPLPRDGGEEEFHELLHQRLAT